MAASAQTQDQPFTSFKDEPDNQPFTSFKNEPAVQQTQSTGKDSDLFQSFAPQQPTGEDAYFQSFQTSGAQRLPAEEKQVQHNTLVHNWANTYGTAAATLNAIRANEITPEAGNDVIKYLQEQFHTSSPEQQQALLQTEKDYEARQAKTQTPQKPEAQPPQDVRQTLADVALAGGEREPTKATPTGTQLVGATVSGLTGLNVSPSPDVTSPANIDFYRGHLQELLKAGTINQQQFKDKNDDLTRLQRDLLSPNRLSGTVGLTVGQEPSQAYADYQKSIQDRLKAIIPDYQQLAQSLATAREAAAEGARMQTGAPIPTVQRASQTPILAQDPEATKYSVTQAAHEAQMAELAQGRGLSPEAEARVKAQTEAAGGTYVPPEQLAKTGWGINPESPMAVQKTLGQVEALAAQAVVQAPLEKFAMMGLGKLAYPTKYLAGGSLNVGRFFNEQFPNWLRTTTMGRMVKEAFPYVPAVFRAQDVLQNLPRVLANPSDPDAWEHLGVDLAIGVGLPMLARSPGWTAKAIGYYGRGMANLMRMAAEEPPLPEFNWLGQPKGTGAPLNMWQRRAISEAMPAGTGLPFSPLPQLAGKAGVGYLAGATAATPFARHDNVQDFLQDVNEQGLYGALFSLFPHTGYEGEETPAWYRGGPGDFVYRYVGPDIKDLSPENRLPLLTIKTSSGAEHPLMDAARQAFGIQDNSRAQSNAHVQHMMQKNGIDYFVVPDSTAKQVNELRGNTGSTQGVFDPTGVVDAFNPDGKTQIIVPLSRFDYSNFHEGVGHPFFHLLDPEDQHTIRSFLAQDQNFDKDQFVRDYVGNFTRGRGPQPTGMSDLPTEAEFQSGDPDIAAKVKQWGNLTQERALNEAAVEHFGSVYSGDTPANWLKASPTWRRKLAQTIVNAGSKIGLPMVSADASGPMAVSKNVALTAAMQPYIRAMARGDYTPSIRATGKAPPGQIKIPGFEPPEREAPPAPAPAPPVPPTHEAIEKLAHELSQRPDAGTPVENWLRAERILTGTEPHPDVAPRMRPGVEPVPAAERTPGLQKGTDDYYKRVLELIDQGFNPGQAHQIAIGEMRPSGKMEPIPTKAPATPTEPTTAIPRIKTKLPQGYTWHQALDNPDRVIYEIHDPRNTIVGRFDYARDPNGIWRPSAGGGLELLDPNLRGKGLGRQIILNDLLPNLKAIGSTGVSAESGTSEAAQKMWKSLEAHGAKIEDTAGHDLTRRDNPPEAQFHTKAWVIRQQGPTPEAKQGPTPVRSPTLRAQAIETLASMGIKKKEAAGHVDAVPGTTEAEIVANALKRRQAMKEGKMPSFMPGGEGDTGGFKTPEFRAGFAGVAGQAQQQQEEQQEEQVPAAPGKVVGVKGTEFGEIDNPQRGGYSEPGWNRGAWGADLTGEDNVGFALPASVLSHVGYTGQKGYGDYFNSHYLIRVHNPKTGAVVEGPLKDLGPGASTGALLDMLWGAREKLGFAPNFSGAVNYEIVDKNTGKVVYAPTGHEIAEGGGSKGAPKLPGFPGGPTASAVPSMEKGPPSAPAKQGPVTGTPEGYEAPKIQATAPSAPGPSYTGQQAQGETAEGSEVPAYYRAMSSGYVTPPPGGEGSLASFMPGPAGEAPGLQAALNRADASTSQKGRMSLLNQAMRMHADSLGEDDERVQKDPITGLFKGRYFVPGDTMHDYALAKTPELHKQYMQRAEDAMKNGQLVHLSYVSSPVKEGQAPPTRESRTAEYALSPAQARAVGSAKGIVGGHSIIPTAEGITFAKTKGGTNTGFIQGISTSVAANNAEHINRKLAGQSPYPDTTSRKFLADLHGYIHNINNGWEGDGSKPIRPTAGVTIKPTPGHVPYPIERKEANFMNAILQNTAAKEKGPFAQQMKGFARAGGRLLNEAGEVNPIRAQIDAADPGWSERTLDPAIKHFRGDLIYGMYNRPEEMHEPIRPAPGTAEVAHAMQRQGLPHKEMVAAGYMPFGGPKAKGWKEAQASGKVFETPVSGGGGRQRFEISDRDMKFVPAYKPTTPGGQPLRNHLEEAYHADPRGRGEIRLDEAIDHPELFRNYPYLRGTKIGMDPTIMENGHYEHPWRDDYGNAKGDRIVLRNPENKVTLAHEIQHAVQHIEGFPVGSSPDAEYKRLKEHLGVREEMLKQYEADHPERRTMSVDDFKRSEVDRKAWEDTRLRKMAEAMYYKTPGEIEARVVGSRATQLQTEPPEKDLEFGREWSDLEAKKAGLAQGIGEHPEAMQLTAEYNEAKRRYKNYRGTDPVERDRLRDEYLAAQDRLTSWRPKGAPPEPEGPPNWERVQASYMPGGEIPKYRTAEPEEFITQRNKSKRPQYLSELSPEDIKNHQLYMSEDGTSGVAIDPQGDIQNVFNNGGPQGAGAHAVVHAINNGGRTLDAYDPYLPGFYRQFGFNETGRMKFNPAYAKSNWDFEHDDHPDVVFMGWNGYPKGDRDAAIARAKRQTEPLPNDRAQNYYPAEDWDRAKDESRAYASRTEANRVAGENPEGEAYRPGSAPSPAAGEAPGRAGIAPEAPTLPSFMAGAAKLKGVKKLDRALSREVEAKLGPRPDDPKQERLYQKAGERLDTQIPEAIPLEVAYDEKGKFRKDEKGGPLYKKVNYDIANSPLLREKGQDLGYALNTRTGQMTSMAKAPQGTVNRIKELDPQKRLQPFLNPTDQLRVSHLEANGAADTYADELVKYYRSIEHLPEVMAGKEWYDEAEGLLGDKFGKHKNLMANLLAATSAGNKVKINYNMAIEAYHQFMLGKYDKAIELYRHAYDIKQSGKGNLMQHIIENGIHNLLVDKNGKPAPEPPPKTDEAAMEQWIAHHGITPKSGAGKLFGHNSIAVLKVLAHTWEDEAGGPKTPNFAGNLNGRSLQATIDMWAARTMRRLGYEGRTGGEPWLIQPAAETGVNDVDFGLSQIAFRKAAERLGLKPSSLQAILWFAEQKHWQANKWERAQDAEDRDYRPMLKAYKRPENVPVPETRYHPSQEEPAAAPG